MEHQEASESDGRRRRSTMPLWLETLLLLVLALLLAVVVKTFFLQAFYIPSGSMEPLFDINDRILVEKPSYWGGGTPQRGDVIVFSDPGGWLAGAESSAPPSPVVSVLEKIGLYPTGGHLVKRVIGVGGDRVVCCDKHGEITVNGHALDETSYLPKGTMPSEQRFAVRVPAHHLWVMGDNRGNSLDSRGHIDESTHGFVSDKLVVGKAFALVWPFSRATFVHRPSDFAGVPDPK